MEDALGDLADNGLWETLYSAEAPPLDGSTIVPMRVALLVAELVPQMVAVN